MPPKKKVSDYIKEVKAWCAENGKDHGYPRETENHPGCALARKLRINKGMFSESEKSELQALQSLSMSLSEFFASDTITISHR